MTDALPTMAAQQPNMVVQQPQPQDDEMDDYADGTPSAFAAPNGVQTSFFGAIPFAIGNQTGVSAMTQPQPPPPLFTPQQAQQQPSVFASHQPEQPALFAPQQAQQQQPSLFEPQQAHQQQQQQPLVPQHWQQQPSPFASNQPQQQQPNPFASHQPLQPSLLAPQQVQQQQPSLFASHQSQQQPSLFTPQKAQQQQPGLFAPQQWIGLFAPQHRQPLPPAASNSVGISMQPPLSMTASSPSGSAFNTTPVAAVGSTAGSFSKATTTAPSVNPLGKSLFPPKTSDTAPKAIATEPPLNGSGTDDTASRQTRFDDVGDISALYNQERDEREKERARLIKAGVIDDPEVKKTLEEAITFVGTCTEMCPRFECIQRQHQRMVDRLELTDGKPDDQLFVKSFHRPAAGMENPLPQDVRTPETLVESLRYLVHDILGNNPWQDCHAFVRDRTRSIRQDFTFQNYEGDELVECTEIIARFHILALYKMIGHPDHAEFMECEQLDKCLTTLGFLYRDGKKKGTVFPNESEFRAYMILRHLRDLYVEQQLALREWPEEVWESNQVKHALRIYTAAQRYDRWAEDGLHAQHYFNTFFELANASETDLLMGCLVQICFAEVRKYALKIISENYMKTSKMTTVQFIKDCLRYETVEQVMEDLQQYGLTVAEHTIDGVPYLYLVTGKNLFNGENNPTRTRAHPSLMGPKEAASGKSLSDLIWGHGQQICHRAEMESSSLQKSRFALDRNHSNERNAKSRIAALFDFPEAGMGETDDYDEDLGDHQETPVSASTVAPNPSSTFVPVPVPLPAPTPAPAFTSASTSASAPTFIGQNPFMNSPFAGASTGTFANNPFASPLPASQFDSKLPEKEPAPSANVLPPPEAKLPETKLPEFKPAESKAFSFAPSVLNSAVKSKLPDFKAPESQPFSRFRSGPVRTSPASESPKSDEVGVVSPVTEPLRFNLDTSTPTDQTPSGQPPKSDAPRSLFDRITPPAKAPVFSEPVQDDNPLFFPPPRFGLSHKSPQPVSPVKKDPVPSVKTDPLPPAVHEPPPPIEDPKPTAEMEAKAETFNKRRIVVPVFYQYVEKAKRKLRRTERRQRKEREKHRAAFAQDPQWWPIAKESEWYNEPVQKVRERVFKPAEIEVSVPDIVHLALEKSGISNSTYRMLLHNNDLYGAGGQSGQSEFWFQQKFFGAKEEIVVRSMNGSLNQFIAQPVVYGEQAPEVGLLLFGCSADFTVSNEERFARDRDNLHTIVEHLTKVTNFQSIAVMVICYRSPIDTEPANPTGLDDTRTLGSERRKRVELVKGALGFSHLGDKVVGEQVVMVETVRDLDLSHEVRNFAQDYILETVNTHYSPSNSSSEGSHISPVETSSETKKRRRKEVQEPGNTLMARNLSQEKRRRVRDAPPKTLATPLPVEATPRRTSPTSSSNRMKNGDTPIRRFHRKREEDDRRETARMKINAAVGMHGFKMVVRSPTAPPPPPKTPPPPLMPLDTSRVRKGINEVEKMLAEYNKFLDDHAL